MKLLRAALLLVLAVAALGCEREMRKLSKQPSDEAPMSREAVGQRPGEVGPGLVETKSTRSFDGNNAFEMNQGKRLFRWMNCVGCHSNGGGGMGPALMDDKWLYGHEPEQIFATIMDGRPNGMPSFRGRLTQEQAWQLVAYVRSMSGLASKIAAPSRSDGLATTEPESRRERAQPRYEPPPKP